MWYRYDSYTYTWANGKLDDEPVGLRIGAGWQNEYETFAVPDACQWVNPAWPTRPQVISWSNAPVALGLSTNGHVRYSYTDVEGRAIYAEAADLTGGTPVRLAAVPGMVGLTGTAPTAENEDGRIQILGNGLDAEVHSNTQTSVGGSWGQADTLGGYFITPIALVRRKVGNTALGAADVLTAFSADEGGLTWFRGQSRINSPMSSWVCLGERPRGAPLLDNRRPITVVPTTKNLPLGYIDYTLRIIGLDRNGTFHVRANSGIAGEVCAPESNTGDRLWNSLGGSGFVGPASALLMSGQSLQVFATGPDGVVCGQGALTGGLNGTWTPVAPGLTAAGPPSAVLAPDGKIKVVVRGSDGLIYYTSQTAPDTATFAPWQAIADSDETATDPTALAVPASNTWVVAYRTDLDVPRLRRYVPPPPPAAAVSDASAAFIDVPMTPPA